MIDALTGNGIQYFYGTKYIDAKDTRGQFFQYELLENKRKTYSTVINNLIETQGRTTIKTNWDLKWKVRDIIVDNDGERYKVQEVVKMPLEVNAQVGHFAKNPDIDYVLSLVRISNPMEL